MIEPLDLDYAAAGWLLSPWGRVRAIEGLDRLAGDARTLGASLWWDCADGARPGYCVLGRREIVLAGWLYWVQPWIMRRVIAEELAHLRVGLSDERARLYAARTYRDLIEPAWVA